MISRSYSLNRVSPFLRPLPTILRESLQQHLHHRPMSFISEKQKILCERVQYFPNIRNKIRCNYWRRVLGNILYSFLSTSDSFAVLQLIMAFSWSLSCVSLMHFLSVNENVLQQEFAWNSHDDPFPNIFLKFNTWRILKYIPHVQERTIDMNAWKRRGGLKCRNHRNATDCSEKKQIVFVVFSIFFIIYSELVLFFSSSSPSPPGFL